MRVAFDATPLIGEGTGVATFVRELFSRLARQPDVDLVGYALSMSGRTSLSESLPAGVTASNRPMAASVLLRTWARVSLPPIEWFTGPVDVVHGTNFVAPPTVRAAAVVTVHDLTAVRFPHLCTPASLRYPDLIRVAVARGAWVHTLSQSMADEVVDVLGAPVERVRVVPSGVAEIHGDPERGRMLAGSSRYVLALGTIEPRKDLPTLVEAFDRIAGDRPDLVLCVAGAKGWGAEAFEAAVEGTRFGSRIRVLGRVGERDRADLLHGATVLAFPSIYEGFGYPPLEAMAVGTPVVATAVGALPETAADGADLVAAHDVGELAAALARVVDDSAHRASLVSRGRQRAQRFSWEGSVAGMLALYAEACDAPAARHRAAPGDGPMRGA